MAFFKWLVAGLVGAGIGAAVWVAIGYFAEYEVGYIAWGIGLLAGIGVRVGAGDTDGVGPGVAAVGAAVFSILVAKYLVISLSMNAAFADVGDIDSGPISQEESISMIAYEVANEVGSEGLAWPEDDAVYDDDDLANDFPPGIWEKAEERWDGMSPTEQTAKIEKIKADQKEFADQFAGQLKAQIFQQSFSPFDLLWFGLAAFTAFKVGSNVAEE